MNSQIKTKSRRKYDADFKAQVIKMVENGKPVTEVAQALGIGENLIYRWKNAIKPKSGLDKRGKNEDSNNLQSENQALREKIKQMEMEQAILKKALAIFSRQI
ncbi:MAG: transposase [Verrucomicrobia bacterium]|nr:transposase [Cytophagales bacterium]